jgi:hypothetical protein
MAWAWIGVGVTMFWTASISRLLDLRLRWVNDKKKRPFGGE